MCSMLVRVLLTRRVPTDQQAFLDPARAIGGDDTDPAGEGTVPWVHVHVIS